VRSAIVRPDGTVEQVERRSTPPETPALGLVELDPRAIADAALETAGAALAAGGPVDAVGVTAQRASAVAWDARDGTPLGPGLGWQDLRTAGTCLELQAQGLRLSPSESATKMAWLLDTYAPDRPPWARVGTVDTWIAWTLSGGGAHITDPSNAAMTGLVSGQGSAWDGALTERLRIPDSALATIVDSSGALTTASSLAGQPPVCGLIGDQQASMLGQGCTRPGLAKATFGTGAMLDACTGEQRPAYATRGPGGCYPIIAWRLGGRVTWGTEAIMLAAGTAVDWLVEDLGMAANPSEVEALAASCPDSGGVVVVPALLGMGTPQWDFGARGAVLGFTRGSGRPQLARAVLEGVAQSGADLLEAAEKDAGTRVERLRLDGGMSANAVFVQALADACARPIEVSPELEATALGVGYLAGLAAGTWSGTDEISRLWAPRAVIEPAADAGRQRWADAVERARRWYPELTAVQF
jgi:glycerol kinase